MTEKKSKPIYIKIHGNALTTLLREAAECGNVTGVLGMWTGELATRENLLAIVERRAELRGNSDSGLEIHYLKGVKATDPWGQHQKIRE